MNMPALKHSQIHQGFYNFINEDVLPACGIASNVFWHEAESLISDYLTAPSDYIDMSSPETINSLAANSQKAAITNKGQLIALNNQRWTSLFASDLDSTASKNYLDQHFALETGSHSQVKNYVVYYHHLLAFFEDGSQSGLANPSQFVALCGHKCAPDSLVFKYLTHDLHIELIFDRKGENGKNDCAGIQDIMVETNDSIVADFSAVQVDGDSKVQTYRNLQLFLQGRLETHKIENGRQRTKRMRTEISFTDVNGEDYSISQRSPMQIQCAQEGLETDLLKCNSGEFAPQMMLDAIVATLLLHTYSNEAQASITSPIILSQGSLTAKALDRLNAICRC
ncbi:malate synthase [Glaciecola sp. MH2013]|nr:malate synthase [Glaciecola sp. MH2013]